MEWERLLSAGGGFCFAPFAVIATNIEFCNAGQKHEVVAIGFGMARRRQFKGICWDVLNNFVSRYNDLNGYWAVGQFAQIADTGTHNLKFQLRKGVTVPPYPEFSPTSSYYWRMVVRLMTANKMPEVWLSDAAIVFSMAGPTIASCSIEITTDLGKIYHHTKTIAVRPHDQMKEHQRLDRFGPSNQKGV